MRRKIVNIDETKCNGCGLCATACAEGAIKIVNGKAKLIGDSYCDGLGACLGECPQGAIIIEEREAMTFDEARAIKASPAAKHSAHRRDSHASGGFVCPGSMTRQFHRPEPSSSVQPPGHVAVSELAHWPVQLHLVSPNAPYFQDADLLLVADCVPFALADFHSRFLKGKSVVVGCPKLDDCAFYVEKLTAILKGSSVKSLTVLHMEVPCCFGMSRVAQEALAASGKEIPLHDVTIGLNGQVRSEG